MIARTVLVLSIVLCSSPSLAKKLPKTGTVCLSPKGMSYSVPVRSPTPVSASIGQWSLLEGPNPDYPINEKPPLVLNVLCEATIDRATGNVYVKYAEPNGSTALACGQAHTISRVPCKHGEPSYP